MSSSDLKFTLRSIVDKHKLNGTNFIDWERNLRIVLRSEGREDVLETPIPILTDASTDEQKAEEKVIRDKSVPVTCLMLAAMEPSLQKRFERSDAQTIMANLKVLFQAQARIERYETNKAILDKKLEKGKPVGPHVFVMIGYFDQMDSLGFPYKLELATDIILHSLHDGFSQFILNYNMHSMGKSLNELHGMLKTAEQNLNVDTKKEVLMVNKGKGFKKGGNGKQKQGKGKQVAQTKTTQKTKVAAADDCFYCKAKGYWMRNCPKYLEDKKNGTVIPASGTKK